MKELKWTKPRSVSCSVLIIVLAAFIFKGPLQDERSKLEQLMLSQNMKLLNIEQELISLQKVVIYNDSTGCT